MYEGVYCSGGRGVYEGVYCSGGWRWCLCRISSARAGAHNKGGVGRGTSAPRKRQGCLAWASITIPNHTTHTATHPDASPIVQLEPGEEATHGHHTHALTDNAYREPPKRCGGRAGERLRPHSHAAELTLPRLSPLASFCLSLRGGEAVGGDSLA